MRRPGFLYTVGVHYRQGTAPPNADKNEHLPHLDFGRTCGKEDEDGMYKLVEQNVTATRQTFTSTLKKLAADDGQETVVIVRNRGEAVAAIVSAREIAKYLSWKADETRTTKSVGQILPDGWPTPEEFVRECLAKGCSPKVTTEAVIENYAPHGLTLEETERIVDRVFGERKAAR